MHLKIQSAPKNWPISRKENAYVVRPSLKGIPVLVLIRDMLKIADNRLEVRKAILAKKILHNTKPIRNEKESFQLFDTLNIVPEKKVYRLTLSEKGKFSLEEIKTEEDKKIAKIINKKTLKGKKVQINLSDGRNFLFEGKCNVNDSALVSFKDKKIEKCFSFKEKAKVLIFSGKHAGTKGIVEKIDNVKKTIEVETKKGKITALIKQTIITEWKNK